MRRNRQHPLLSGCAEPELLAAALEAAGKASRSLRSRFLAADNTTWRKDDGSFVTDVDVHAEEQIRDFLSNEFPHIGFDGEETGRSDRASGLIWKVDPLDGTDNYVCGIPYFATSVALIGQGGARLGIVINAISQETFVAELGRGAYLNGVRISPARLTDSSRALRVAVNPDFTTKHSPAVRAVLARLHAGAFRLLDMWAPTLDWCMLAKSSIDAVVTVSNAVPPADAGPLIAAESGACLLQPSTSSPATGGYYWTISMHSSHATTQLAATVLQ